MGEGEVEGEEGERKEGRWQGGGGDCELCCTYVIVYYTHALSMVTRLHIEL